MNNPGILMLAALAVVWAYYAGADHGRQQGLVSAAESSPAMESYFTNLDRNLADPSEADAVLSEIEAILNEYLRQTASLNEQPEIQ